MSRGAPPGVAWSNKKGHVEKHQGACAVSRALNPRKNDSWARSTKFKSLSTHSKSLGLIHKISPSEALDAQLAAQPHRDYLFNRNLGASAYVTIRGPIATLLGPVIIVINNNSGRRSAPLEMGPRTLTELLTLLSSPGIMSRIKSHRFWID